MPTSASDLAVRVPGCSNRENGLEQTEYAQKDRQLLQSVGPYCMVGKGMTGSQYLLNTLVYFMVETVNCYVRDST